MDLQEYMAEHMTGHIPDATTSSLAQTAAWNKVHPIIGSEAYAEPFLTGVFWQIYQTSPAFEYQLFRAGALPHANERVTTVVVPHGADDATGARFDLLVMDPSYRGQPVPIAVDASARELFSGWNLWYDRMYSLWRAQSAAVTNSQEERESEQMIRYVQSIDPDFAVEALRIKPFSMMLIEEPAMRLTRAPSPCWGAAKLQQGPYCCTVGVLATDKQTQKRGVTVPLHAFNDNRDSPIVPGSTQVYIGGNPGTILRVDDLSDSAFVEMPDGPAWQGLTKGNAGPLTGRGPGLSEQGTFEGVRSGQQSAYITGFNPYVPLKVPNVQCMIYSNAVTEEGDSGAALINDEDRILGFACSRTGIGSPVEFSAWIWAESVFDALGIE